MEKATQTKAHYTRCGTEAKHCSICTMFRPPDQCTAVAGKISRDGYCDYFKKRRTPRAPSA